MSVSVDDQKRNSAFAAVDALVESDTVIGLGTGSTAKHAVDRVAQRIHDGSLKNVSVVATSTATAEQCASLGVPLVDLCERLAVCIDGADEVSCPHRLDLVKGRGAALLREKMVARRASKFAIICDESKRTWEKTKIVGIGHDGAMPVEVVQFASQMTMSELAHPLQAKWTPSRVSFRMGSGGQLLITDNGNYIVDLFFDAPIQEVEAFGIHLKGITGVVDHGLFLHMATHLFVGMSDGSVQVNERKEESLQ
eukprot:GHVH01010613.1.p1 GENE.GHVH01010613.1~~GHVH01010613.1.p1  ORF type:complete len:252 (+),score=52.70 GHVH01010613.1:31-786(+)